MILKGLFKDESRKKHFKYAIPIGAVFTMLCVLGCASGMEFKDEEHGGKWDWGDWWCTMFGGMVGQIIQIGIIYVAYILLWK